MNLDWLMAVGNGAGQLKVQATGPLTSDMTFEARLSADGLSAQAGGSGQLSEGEGVRAKAALRVTSADLRPILTGPAAGSSLPLQMTSRVTIAGEAMTFEAIGDLGFAGRAAVQGPAFAAALLSTVLRRAGLMAASNRTQPMSRYCLPAGSACNRKPPLPAMHGAGRASPS